MQKDNAGCAYLLRLFFCAVLCVGVHTLCVCACAAVSGDLWPASQLLITFYFSVDQLRKKHFTRHEQQGQD